MNWLNRYWRTWPAGIAISVTLACAVGKIVKEAGIRRDTARRESLMEEARQRWSGTAAATETPGDPS